MLRDRRRRPGGVRLVEGRLRPREGWTGGAARRGDQGGRLATAARQPGHRGGLGWHAGCRTDGRMAALRGVRGRGPGRQA
eukprot:5344531-Alexandrium_andersonii.AAC.2